MKAAVHALAVIFVLFLAATAQAAEPVNVDVLYMNHGPLRPTLNNLRTMFARYEGQITVIWHDFESAEGQKFIKSMGINEHVPLIIWINGKYTLNVNGSQTIFRGFPSGAGPAMFQGAWNMDLLNRALEQATR